MIRSFEKRHSQMFRLDPLRFPSAQQWGDLNGTCSHYLDGNETMRVSFLLQEMLVGDVAPLDSQESMQ